MIPKNGNTKVEDLEVERIMRRIVENSKILSGSISPPGDKSISHRSVILNSIATGSAKVSNFCVGDDRDSILRCLTALGAKISFPSDNNATGPDEVFSIIGCGTEGLSEPITVLNAGNSGTTIRLISGLLAAQPFFSVITGDDSLRRRPMKRITQPLVLMGSKISGRDGGSLAPLAINGGNLTGINYEMPVASAQLKSAILLAGMHAKTPTTILQPAKSRDHTERMMKAMGADIAYDSDSLEISISTSELKSMDVVVPCDISGASFWMIAGCCHPKAEIKITNVGINPSRIGVLEVLNEMGANIKKENISFQSGEPTADIIVKTSALRSVEIGGQLIPRVIDELPILALAACFAEGKTTIKNAKELRVKESDRISATVSGLKALGAEITETEDGMIIHGTGKLDGGEVQSYHDHRIAMTMGIAGLIASGNTTISNAEAAEISYPSFWDELNNISVENQNSNANS
jgi:3-phosphoshikimate 1-carboxyvinyltransferase